jgi:hypothetical protein
MLSGRWRDFRVLNAHAVTEEKLMTLKDTLCFHEELRDPRAHQMGFVGDQIKKN